MKKLSLMIAVLAQLVLFTACSEEDLVPSGDVPGGGDSYVFEIPRNKITINADVEQQGANTRTVLGGNNAVLWNNGDKFSLMTMDGESIPCSVEATLTAGSQVAAIKVESSAAYVRYSSVKVTQTTTTTTQTTSNRKTTTTTSDPVTKDITSTILDDNGSSSNSYRIGLYNASNNYQVASGGTVMQAGLRNSCIQLIMASSSASFSNSSTSSSGWGNNKTTTTTTNNWCYTVKYEGVEYSYDGVTWMVPTGDQFVTGAIVGSDRADPGELNVVPGTSVQTNEEFTVIPNSSYPSSGTSSQFEGYLVQDAATHYAVYPYSESNTISGDEITFTMPAEQQYVEGSFGNGANPAVGVLEQKDNGDYHISFLNVCGVLKLQLKGTQKIASITVKDKAGKALSGTATVACKDVTATSVAAAEVTGSSSVVLNCGTGVQLSSEPTSFYIVVPAGAFSGGFEVEARSTDGLIGTLETSRDNTIKQNTIKAMPAIELEFVEEFNVENDVASDYLANAQVTLSSTGDSKYNDDSATKSSTFSLT